MSVNPFLPVLFSVHLWNSTKYHQFDNTCDALGSYQNLCESGIVDCHDSLSRPRSAMPQFTTMMEVEEMIRGLKDCQHFVRASETLISYSEIKEQTILLKPIQNQISGLIEQKICNFYHSGKMKRRYPDVGIILVSSERERYIKYILDGHHRAFGWILSKQSGQVGYDDLPVMELIFDRSMTSRTAAETIMNYLRTNHSNLFKKYGITYM